MRWVGGYGKSKSRIRSGMLTGVNRVDARTSPTDYRALSANPLQAFIFIPFKPNHKRCIFTTLYGIGTNLETAVEKSRQESTLDSTTGEAPTGSAHAAQAPPPRSMH